MAESIVSAKPIPVPDSESVPYWKAANEESFMFQRCEDCGKAQFYPRSLCSHCGARTLQWERAKGKGKIVTFSVIHRAPTPAFKGDAPYVLALIDMDEGFRFMCNVINCNYDAVRIGDPVRVVYEQRPGSHQRIPQVELI